LAGAAISVAAIDQRVRTETSGDSTVDFAGAYGLSLTAE
jgi:hypothetical protein